MLDEESFIRLSKEVHGESYDYSLVKYADVYTKVEIICNKGHPNFMQGVRNHLNGHGCMLCGWEKTKVKQTKTTEEFIAEVSNTHRGKYTYERSRYTGTFNKLIVTCPTHGDFSITPDSHRRGTGCCKCASYGYNKGKPGTFYILFSENIVKVGITNRRVQERIKKIIKSSGKDFKLISSMLFDNGEIAQSLEQQILRWLRENYQSPSEVFDGSTECFHNVDINKLNSKVLEILGTLQTE